MKLHFPAIATIGTVASLALASVTALSAQDVLRYPPRFNLSTYAGASIPTGDLRDSFDTGLLLGAQGTYDLGAHLGLLGNFDWTHPTTKLALGDPHANVYQADVGLELGGARGATRKWAMRPFADVGGGVRRYDFSGAGLSDRTRGVGFAALGTEVAVGRSAIRLAATDNVFSYESPMADATHATRNDVGLSLGFGFHP
jgi:hypothetical protein